MQRSFKYKVKKRKIAANYFLLILLFFIVCFGIIYISIKAYYPLKFAPEVLKYSDEYDLDPYLVLGVIHTESKFNEQVSSAKSAMGLMQITPDTLEWIAQKNGETVPDTSVLFVADSNIRYGCMILKSHLNEFGSIDIALAAYNAGRGRVLDWLEHDELSQDGVSLESIPYPETEEYIERVIYAQKVYGILYDLEEQK